MEFKRRSYKVIKIIDKESGFHVILRVLEFLHSYVHKICLNKYRVSCIFEQYVINKGSYNYNNLSNLICAIHP